MTTIEQLISTRQTTHGDWNEQSKLASDLKSLLHRSRQWNTMTAGQREALDMIATKLSRIGSGNPNEGDHWDDIAGYAKLGKEGHK
jgi:hypothetical protein